MDNGWWRCEINGREARVQISESHYSTTLNREKSDETRDLERRNRSGHITSDNVLVSPRQGNLDFISGSSHVTTNDDMDPKKKESVVTKASKLMKGGFDKFKDAVTYSKTDGGTGSRIQLRKKKDEDDKKEVQFLSENSIEVVENHIKDAFCDLETLKTETQLIIKAFNETSSRPFIDNRLPSEETPEFKMFSRMLESPFTPLFNDSILKKDVDITLAPAKTVIYKEILIPHINLNTVSKKELEILSTLDFDIFPFKYRRDEYHAFMLIMSMFYRFDLPTIFKISDETLYRFLYVISRRYRDVPFHNFFHAFNVTQTLYYFLTSCQGHKLFGSLEILCLLIAAICHDCDHPGLTNDFQRKAQTKVYYMHKKSVLENHHYLQCMSVLAMSETNILANLTQEQEDSAYNYLRDLILATDLAVHGVTLKALKDRLKVLQKHFKNGTGASMIEEDRKLIMCALLKCSDLSNEIRKQSISSKWAKLVFEEFISQATKEKEMSLPVTPFMDKEKIIVAKEQMNFIEKLCMPLYDLVAQIVPDVSKSCERLEENRNIWQRRLLLFCEDKKTDIKKLGPNKSLWENKQVKDKGTLSSTLAMRASNSQMIHKRSRSKFTPPSQRASIPEE